MPPPRSDGAWYSPGADTWSALDTAGAPTPRVDGRAIWTGSEVILWGGFEPTADGSARLVADGAVLDPASGAWRTIARPQPDPDSIEPFVVWAGAEMIAWDGARRDPPRVGWRYDPAADSWAPLAPHTGEDRACGVVWTGTELLAFGHASFSRYDPGADAWTVSASTETLCATPVWTGREVLLWRPAGSPAGASVRFDPETETTRPIESDGAPSHRLGFAVFWTGQDMLVWGGEEAGGGATNTGYLYRPPEP